MEQKFLDQFEGLMEKYAELLTGESDQDRIEKIKIWALYSHIAKTMPALAKHWNAQYPDAKEAMMNITAAVKQMNEQHRASLKK